MCLRTLQTLAGFGILSTYWNYVCALTSQSAFEWQDVIIIEVHSLFSGSIFTLLKAQIRQCRKGLMVSSHVQYLRKLKHCFKFVIRQKFWSTTVLGFT